MLSVLLTGLIAGLVANAMTNGRGGLLGSLFVGLSGSVFGAYVSKLMGLSFNGFWPELIISTLGAMFLLLVFSLFHKRAS